MLAMSLLKMPIEIVSLLVELLDAEDVFNMALTCKYLSYIPYDRRMCRLALLVRVAASCLSEVVPANSTSESTIFYRSSGGALYQELPKGVP
jgi:hypothetical protein